MRSNYFMVENIQLNSVKFHYDLFLNMLPLEINNYKKSQQKPAQEVKKKKKKKNKGIEI